MLFCPVCGNSLVDDVLGDKNMQTLLMVSGTYR